MKPLAWLCIMLHLPCLQFTVIVTRRNSISKFTDGRGCIFLSISEWHLNDVKYASDFVSTCDLVRSFCHSSHFEIGTDLHTD